MYDANSPEYRVGVYALGQVQCTLEKNLKTQGDPPLAAIFGNLTRLHNGHVTDRTQ